MQMQFKAKITLVANMNMRKERYSFEIGENVCPRI